MEVTTGAKIKHIPSGDVITVNKINEKTFCGSSTQHPNASYVRVEKKYCVLLYEDKEILITSGKSAEEEISKIKAILGNPQDVIKAVQKLVEENRKLISTSTILIEEKESGAWNEWEKKEENESISGEN